MLTGAARSTGAFEHYPNLKWQDNDFVRVCAMHDWIHFYDRFDHQIGVNQTYELMGYLPFAFAPWFAHFANHSNATRPAEFPKQDYEAFQQRATNEEILGQLALAIPPVLRSLYGSGSISTELAPLLMRILSPKLKPVRLQLADLRILCTFWPLLQHLTLGPCFSRAGPL